MQSVDINDKLVNQLLSGDFLEFNKRLQPRLAGILANGEPVILFNDSNIQKVSSFKSPLNLSGFDLTRYSLMNIDLRHANMRKSRCCGVNFQESLMDFVNFKGSNLEKADFCGARLVYTNMSSCNLAGANFNHADLVNTSFIVKIVTRIADDNVNIDYDGSDLSEIKAIQAYFSGVDFRQCNLSGANFTGSTLKNCIFDSSNLNKSNFSTVQMKNVLFENISEINGISFENSNIMSIRVKGVTFRDCSFSNSLIFDLDLSDTRFENCNFFKTQFTNSDLSRTSAIFKDCSFTASRFTSSSISFDKEKFIDCSFKDALFTDCEIFILDKVSPDNALPKDLNLISPKYESLSILSERMDKIVLSSGINK